MWLRSERVPTALLLLTVVAVTGGLTSGGTAQEEAERKTGAQEGQMACSMMACVSDLGLFADSPAVLLARAEELALGENQIIRLKEIQDEAREQAHNLLTAKQRAKVGTGKTSFMKLCRTRMQKKMAGPKAEMMCPKCMKMMKARDQKPGSGEEDKSQQSEAEKGSCPEGHGSKG